MAAQRKFGSTPREISSPANALLKVFRRALATGTTREGLVAIEGPLLIQEALDADKRAEVHSVLVAKGAVDKHRALLARVPETAEAVVVPDRLFGQVAQTETPQGIAALVELRPCDLGTILGVPNPLLMVACEIQDPGNLGAMVRSAQALGATALIALEDTVNPFNPKAVRASAGALFRLPVIPDQTPRKLFEDLRAAGVRIVAADRRSPSSLAEADLRGPLAILIGNEAAGLPAAISREADLLLSIPIREGMDSLNAATAAGIFLYEAARQRRFNY